MPESPRPGLSFLHAYWFEPNGDPIRYTVTAVRYGCAYIKADGETKAKEVVPLNDWHKVYGSPA